MLSLAVTYGVFGDFTDQNIYEVFCSVQCPNWWADLPGGKRYVGRIEEGCGAGGCGDRRARGVVWRGFRKADRRRRTRRGASPPSDVVLSNDAVGGGPFGGRDELP